MNEAVSKNDQYHISGDWLKRRPEQLGTSGSPLPPCQLTSSGNALTYLQGTYKLTEARAKTMGHKRTSSCSAMFQRQGDRPSLTSECIPDLKRRLSFRSEVSLSTASSKTPTGESDKPSDHAASPDIQFDVNRINVKASSRPSSAVPVVGDLRPAGVSSTLYRNSYGNRNKCTIVEWPVPVPFTPAVAQRFVTSALDTLSIFKYRINYPHLLERMHCYVYSSGQSGALERLPDNVDSFVQEVLRKRALKLQKHPPTTEPSKPPASPKFLLWKRRYYTLLNAVDFACKDNRILTHVCRQGLFHCVSNLPLLWKGTVLKSNSVSVTKDTSDEPDLLAVGSNPIGHLFDRLTQILLRSENHPWPCMFNISVGFLSDVSAQSRILRSDLDRRKLVLNRMLHVLKQAKYQKTKLKSHLARQRELLNTLTVNLAALRQRLYKPSPALDQPSSIDDGLTESVRSPFVDFENTVCERLIAMGTHQPESRTSEVDGQRRTGNPEALECVKHLMMLRSQVTCLERVVKEEEARRKRLHNRIQELTGNIRVFCRLRPRDYELGKDSVDGDASDCYLRVSSDDKLLFCTDTLKENLSVQNRAITTTITTARGIARDCAGELGHSQASPCPPKCFIFDRVFGPRVSQEEVYAEVDDLVVSCLDGYNVCIMAYGQTGSGKTYTMMGTVDNPGVNRRIVHSLFDKCGKRGCWKYTITVSMVEIYQEDVYDLLEDDFCSANGSRRNSPAPSVGTDRKRSLSRLRTIKNKKPPVPWNSWAIKPVSSNRTSSSNRIVRRRGSVKILSDNLDGVVLKNLTERVVHDDQELLDYLELAERQRHIGSTNLNICSSRSHLVILLKVSGQNQLHLSTSSGTLTLADLAGSENVNKSGSTGERFLEAACINKSLSSLGRVFDALRRQEKPTYRETKLTYLLRPTLSGDSKCLLFIALRTEPEHAEETWRAINFGQGAIQVVPSGFDVNKSILATSEHGSEKNADPAEGPKRLSSTIFRCVAPKNAGTTLRRNTINVARTRRLSKTTGNETSKLVKRRWM